MRFRSKRYKGEAEKAGKEALSLVEAVRKVKSFASTKFDQSVECVMHLGVDPKHADQMIRGAVSLPNGIGTPAIIDEDGNGTADLAYAGDLFGNLYRFDTAIGEVVANRFGRGRAGHRNDRPGKRIGAVLNDGFDARGWSYGRRCTRLSWLSQATECNPGHNLVCHCRWQRAKHYPVGSTSHCRRRHALLG